MDNFNDSVGGENAGNELINPALGSLNNLAGPDGLGFFAKLIPSLVGLLFIVGGLAFFFMLLWGAVTWILSGGDKAGIESAKGKITNALIGFVLMVGVFAVVKFIETFFDINILLIDIGPLVIQ